MRHFTFKPPLVLRGRTYKGLRDVETAGDHPVWHKSEVDVFPGQK